MGSSPASGSTALGFRPQTRADPDDEQRAGTSGKLTPAFADLARTRGSLCAFLNVFVLVFRFLAVSIAIGSTATGSSTGAA